MKIVDKTTEKSPTKLISIINSLNEKIRKDKEILSQKDSEIEQLKYRLDLALRQRYAKRSEKFLNDRQAKLFDESDLPTIEEEKETQKEYDTITVPEHQRKKSGRKPLPANLPRLTLKHDLTDEEKICSCGCTKVLMDKEIVEQLEIIPAMMYVIKHILLKYVCKACEGNIQQAKVPPQPIPKSKAGPGLLAHVLVSKFCDHLPLYRQENILKRLGIDLGRASLSQWVIRCGDLVTPLINLLQDTVIEHDIAYADETILQVLKEKDRRPEQKSYMWLFGGGPPDKFSWIYQYHPGRHGHIAKDFFEGFTGYCHVDGYAGYHALERDGVKLSGCMAHARRKFVEVAKSATKKKGVANTALEFIRRLYRLEKNAKANKLSPDAIKKLRQEKSKAILDDFEKWCLEKQNKVPPKSPIGKAIAYTMNQWRNLIRYLEDGRLDIDNNLTERSIKPFVIGRKNWLFCNSVKGAEAGARLYSLIETCKVHQIEPYAYLRLMWQHFSAQTFN